MSRVADRRLTHYLVKQYTTCNITHSHPNATILFNMADLTRALLLTNYPPKSITLANMTGHDWQAPSGGKIKNCNSARTIDNRQRAFFKSSALQQTLRIISRKKITPQRIKLHIFLEIYDIYNISLF